MLLASSPPSYHLGASRAHSPSCVTLKLPVLPIAITSNQPSRIFYNSPLFWNKMNSLKKAQKDEMATSMAVLALYDGGVSVLSVFIVYHLCYDPIDMTEKWSWRNWIRRLSVRPFCTMTVFHNIVHDMFYYIWSLWIAIVCEMVKTNDIWTFFIHSIFLYSSPCRLRSLQDKSTLFLRLLATLKLKLFTPSSLQTSSPTLRRSHNWSLLLEDPVVLL